MLLVPRIAVVHFRFGDDTNGTGGAWYLLLMVIRRILAARNWRRLALHHCPAASNTTSSSIPGSHCRIGRWDMGGSDCCGCWSGWLRPRSSPIFTRTGAAFVHPIRHTNPREMWVFGNWWKGARTLTGQIGLNWWRLIVHFDLIRKPVDWLFCVGWTLRPMIVARHDIITRSITNRVVIGESTVPEMSRIGRSRHVRYAPRTHATHAWIACTSWRTCVEQAQTKISSTRFATNIPKSQFKQRVQFSIQKKKLQKSRKRTQGEKVWPKTNKLTDRCHLTLWPVVGSFTQAENVCFIRPSNLGGLSFGKAKMPNKSPEPDGVFDEK